MLPDVELALTAWARTTLGVTSSTDLPANLTDVMPLVQVATLGGAGGRFDASPRVEVDAYAATREEAHDLAARVHDAIVMLRGTVGALVVRSVRVDSLPTRRPYDNTALCRFGASYTVNVHPTTYA